MQQLHKCIQQSRQKSYCTSKAALTAAPDEIPHNRPCKKIYRKLNNFTFTKYWTFYKCSFDREDFGAQKPTNIQQTIQLYNNVQGH